MLREQGRSPGEQEAAARGQREEQLRHLKLERCQARRARHRFVTT